MAEKRTDKEKKYLNNRADVLNAYNTWNTAGAATTKAKAKLDEENFIYSIEQEDFSDIICGGILVPWICQFEFYDRDLDWDEEQDPDFLLKVSFDEPLQ